MKTNIDSEICGESSKILTFLVFQNQFICFNKYSKIIEIS